MPLDGVRGETEEGRRLGKDSVYNCQSANLLSSVNEEATKLDLKSFGVDAGRITKRKYGTEERRGANAWKLPAWHSYTVWAL